VSALAVEERRRLLLYLYATVFITSIAYGSVTFLLPVYAERLGASYVELGVIGAVGNIVYTVVALLSGILLDRYDRVRFYLAFTVVGIAVLFLFSLVRNVPEMITMRGLLGVVSGAFWVPASTLTADISPPDELTRSVGRFNVAWIAGFMVGPMAGGWISDIYGFPALFVGLALLLVPSAALIFIRLMAWVEPRDRSEGSMGFSVIKPIAMVYVILLPFAIIIGIYMAILPGHMGSLGMTASTIGLLLTMTNGVRGLGFTRSETWVRWGTRKSLWLAAAILSVALFIVALSTGALDFVLPLTLYGVAAGMITPVTLDYIAHRIPSETRGTAMGVHECVYGIGMSLGAMAGGAVAEAFQPSTLYQLLAVLSALIIPLSLTLKTGESEEKSLTQ